jgi:hypothetical protein
MIIRTIAFHGNRIVIEGQIPIGQESSSIGEMRVDVPL